MKHTVAQLSDRLATVLSSASRLMPHYPKPDPRTFDSAAEGSVPKPLVIEGEPAVVWGAGHAERQTALVVEDDLWLRCVVTDLLECEGYVVQQASNGPAALRIARRHVPDIVLLDLALPELSGLAVLAGLKEDSTTCRVPVIVVSGMLTAYPAAAQWAAAIVRKPFELSDLLTEVTQATRACVDIGGAGVFAPPLTLPWT